MGNSTYKEKYEKLQKKYRASRASNRTMSMKIAQDNIISTRKVINRSVATTKKAVSEMKAQLKSNGCCLCGFDKHQALDFHHVDKKSGNLSAMSPVQIVNEINTCFIVVICSNCHRLLHTKVITPDFTGKRLVI